MSRHLLQYGRGPILDIIKYLQSFAVFFETLNFEELLQHFRALWGGGMLVQLSWHWSRRMSLCDEVGMRLGC